MMSNPAIRIQHVGKEYQLGVRETRYATLRESLLSVARAPWRRFQQLSGRGNSRGQFWALKDVSIDVEPGEVVGIIGRNGAGKSTLLKILSQITEPTVGEVQIRGRVGSLLEVGTGFHPELTGRENIFLNGAILGMARAEVKCKFDEIVDFSGVEEFLDTPVKRYSSGMQVRLAFAVAAHLEPEILIVDEVLAVGDAEFQNKCLGKMSKVAGSGRTVLFVTHNMAAVENLCSRACLLAGGQLVATGEVGDIVQRYLGAGLDLAGDIDLRQHAGRSARCRSVFSRLRILNSHGELSPSVRVGEDIQFEMHFSSSARVSARALGFRIVDSRGLLIIAGNSRHRQDDRPFEVNGVATATCTVVSPGIVPGRYQLQLFLRNSTTAIIDEIESGIEFEVLPVHIDPTVRVPHPQRGIISPGMNWSFVCP
jgi:lipopolysaccharide transport system ATP-binding protein